MTYYFLYNSVSGVILAANTVGFTPGTGQAVAQFDPATNDAAIIAYQYPQRYLITGSPPALVLQPYWTATASVSGQTVTVTATLQNPPSSPPTSATLTILGQSLTTSVSNNTATWTVDVHESVSDCIIVAVVSASGTGNCTLNIGGSQAPQVGLQLVPATSSTNPLVAPAGPGSKAYLRAFYLGLTPQNQIAVLTEALQNLMLAVSSTNHVLVTKIIPALTASSYSPISLTTEEQSALTNWQDNVVPYLVGLADLLSSSGQPIPAYAELQAMAPQVAQSLQAYQEAVAAIPGLE